MIPNIGIGEIAVVLVIALIVLGPSKLPIAARSAGRGFREFKAALSGMDPFDDDDGNDDAGKKSVAKPGAPSSS